MIDGEGGRQLHGDITMHRSGTPSDGKRQLIRGEGSITRISNRLCPQDPGGGVRLTWLGSDGCVLPVDMDSRGGDSEGQDCFPLSQGLIQRPVPRPDDDRLTGPSGWPPAEGVEVSAVLVDATLDTVVMPAAAGEAGINGGASDKPVSVRRAAWAGLDFCDSMVGGLTFAFLDGADEIVDLAGDAAVGVVSSVVAEVASSAIAEMVPSAVDEVVPSAIAGVASSAVAEVASSAVAEVAPSAVVETVSSVIAEVASSAVDEVASLADAGVASPADIVEAATLVDSASVDTDGGHSGRRMMSRMIRRVTMMTIFMMCVMIRTLTILTTMIRRILIVTLMCMVLLNPMIMSCVMVFMDRMIVECIVWLEVKPAGCLTGLAMRNVTFVLGMLLYPGPGPMSRLTEFHSVALVALPWTGSSEPINGILLVILEPVKRLAVLVHHGPGGRKVTVPDRLVVLFVQMTIV